MARLWGQMLLKKRSPVELASSIKRCESQSHLPHITASGRKMNWFRLGFHMKAQHVAEQLIKIPRRRFLFLGSDNTCGAVAPTQDLWSAATHDMAE